MMTPQPPLSDLRDERLAPHAISAAPAWLWSDDGRAILWVNAVGAAMFGASDVASVTQRFPDAAQGVAGQIARLAPTLPHGGSQRLERLRMPGMPMGRPLLCLCSRLSERGAVLVVAAEPAGPNLSLAERVRRLLASASEPLAGFADDETLICANDAAKPFLGSRTRLQDFDTASTIVLGTGTERIIIAALTMPQITLGPPLERALQPVEEIAPREEQEPRETPIPPEADREPSPAIERRYPLRFVWQMDADEHFTLSASEFADLIGPAIADMLGRPWREIARELALDPEGKVAAAVASRNTWSGVIVQWPVEGSDRRLPVELSGLPIYDRDRVFRGYRGFGVCRDFDLIDAVLAERNLSRRKPASRDNLSARTEPPLTFEPRSQNVVPFPATDPKVAALTPGERNAFRELASRLTARLKEADELATRAPGDASSEQDAPHSMPPVSADQEIPISLSGRSAIEGNRSLLDGLPLGVLIYRHDHLIHANPVFLEWAGYKTLSEFAEAGGLEALLVEPSRAPNAAGAQSLRVTSPGPEAHPVDARLVTILWDSETAMALMLAGPAKSQTETPAPAVTTRPTLLEEDRAAEDLASILDLMEDGVLLLDRARIIAYANRQADALFGYDAPGRMLADLLAPDSALHVTADVEALANDPAHAKIERDVVARQRDGRLVPLSIRIGRLKSGEFCVVFRRIVQWKETEQELVAARRKAETMSAAKSDFLARVSHEIRTPLNAIIGFSEVMSHERFGPIGNERYRQYLKDIQASGEHLVELLSDIVDLSKIEAGKLELNPATVSLNDIAHQAVTIMQPQATRERVVMRVALSSDLQNIIADPRSVRQILLNLLSNAIKFTEAGGQIIVSTASSGRGGVVLRVRDTGRGMSAKDLAVALEPFRQVGTDDRVGPRGSGLGLPLTKALAEANRARFSIESAENSGTLVEIEFPAARMVAE